jgi:p-hydroxybenzoate 3-monooxygenase
MTTMLHLPPGGDAFDLRLQHSQLRYVTTSTAQASALAENYVGLAEV